MVPHNHPLPPPPPTHPNAQEIAEERFILASPDGRFIAGPNSRWEELKNLWFIFLDFFRALRTFHFVGPCVTIFGSARIKEGHPWLTSLLKQSIWNFSSKVNHRLPLQSFFKHNFAANGKAPAALASHYTSKQNNDINCTLTTNKSTIDQLSYFIWHYAFAKKVKEFQKKFIQERLFVASKF